MDDHDGGETLFLVGEHPSLEPIVESWLSAGKFGNVVRRSRGSGAESTKAQLFAR